MLHRLAFAAVCPLLISCAAVPRQQAPTENVAGEYLSARFAANTRDLAKAAAAYEAAAAGSREPSIVGQAFEYALAAGDIDAAASFAAQLIGVDLPAPEDGRSAGVAAFQSEDLPQLTLAVTAIQDRNWDEAMKWLGGEYGSSLGRSLAFMLEGWSLYGKSGVDAGTEHLASPPSGVFAGFVPYHSALMYDLTGRTTEAQAAYAAALETAAADEAAIAFALLQEREGRAEEAIRLYHRMAEGRGLARRVGRMGLARLGDPLDGESEAFIRVAKEAERRPVENAQEGAALILAGFANAAFDQASQERMAAARAGFGDIELALNGPLGFARLASYLDDDQSAAQYVTGAIAATYDQPVLAEAAYAKVRPSSAYYSFAVMDRAEALFELDRTDEAASLLENYLEQDPLSPDIAYVLASIYAEQERWDDALRAGAEAIEVAIALAGGDETTSSLWRYHFARGANAVEAGRWDVGEQELRQALALSPSEATVLNYLGYSYVERGERLDEAFGMIEQALRLQPTSGAITDSLGWAHYQRGDYEKAVEYLENAVRLEPGDDVITDHLGDAYWQAGRHTEARYEWRRVLEIEELDAELRASVEAKLDGRPPEPGTLASRDI